MNSWGSPLEMVLNILFFILMVAGVIMFIVWIARQSSGAAHTESASEILKMRYAKGEITKEQYEEMKRSLE